MTAASSATSPAAGVAAAPRFTGQGRPGRQDGKSGHGRKINHSHHADSYLEPL
jgi:hypothetical protein